MVRFVAREAYDSCDLDRMSQSHVKTSKNSLEAVRRLMFNAMRWLMRAVDADELQLQLHQGRICLRYMIKEGESRPVITTAAVLMPPVTLHEVTENQINSRRDLLDAFSETATTAATSCGIDSVCLAIVYSCPGSPQNRSRNLHRVAYAGRAHLA